MEAIAFDLGGSGGKLFRGRLNNGKLELSVVHRFENRAVSLGGDLYWPLMSIWNDLCIGLQKAQRECDFATLGIDAFCNDFGFISISGSLLSPVRCYRDPRTLRCADAIYKKAPPAMLYGETGNQIAPFSTFMQLAAMRTEHDDLLIEHADNLLFLPDLLTFFITGERVAERTLCSVSQMYRTDTNCWSEKILQTHAIPSKLFAKVVDSGAIVGSASKEFLSEWNLRPFKQVAVCEHDTASAFLATPGVEERVIISSGTWALVGCETKAPVINKAGFSFNLANEGSLPGHNRLLRNVMGSWILQELRAEYASEGKEYSYAQLLESAKECKPFAFLIDVDNNVFYSPGNMRGKIRAHCLSASQGSLPETPGELTRCICESLALKYRYAVECLETVTGKHFELINVIGGGANDSLTCQMTASACNLPVRAGPVDASAIGNLLVQMLAYGEIASIEEGRQIVAASFPCETYEPVDSDTWNDAYRRFSEFFPR